MSSPDIKSVNSATGFSESMDILWRRKLIVAGWALTLAVLAGLGSLLIPNTYTARTLLLPPQQGQSSGGSALAALGVLSAGLGGAANIKSPEELYVSLLKSDSIGDNVVARFKLTDAYETSTVSEARNVLARRVLIVADRKSGLIRVEVDDGSAKLAADIANSYAEELRGLMNRIAVTESSQRRVYFEEQAKLARNALAEAELSFQAAQEKFGIQSIDVRAQGDIRALSELRAQAMARAVQVKAMQSYAGPENADVRRLNAEISSLQDQILKLERGTGASVTGSAEALGNQRAYREMKYQEAILSGLITQAELARGDEARQAPLVQQVDIARVPDRKSAPRRSMFALLGGVAGLILGTTIVLKGQFRRRRPAANI